MSGGEIQNENTNLVWRLKGLERRKERSRLTCWVASEFGVVGWGTTSAVAMLYELDRRSDVGMLFASELPVKTKCQPMEY
jgi:hypothetical protein